MMLRDNCTTQPLLKFPFEIDRNCHRKGLGAPNECIDNTIPVFMAWKTWRKRGLKHCRKKKTKKVCCEIVSPRDDREAPPMTPQQYGRVNKKSTMAILTDRATRKGKAEGVKPLGANYKQLKTDQKGRISLTQRWAPNWLSNTKK